MCLVVFEAIFWSCHQLICKQLAYGELCVVIFTFNLWWSEKYSAEFSHFLSYFSFIEHQYVSKILLDLVYFYHIYDAVAHV